MFKRLIFSLSLLMTSICQAQQSIPVQEGTEVTVTISANVLNRIAVENDRILTVKGISGQFELDKDAELGQVFLKPIATDKQELIHLFITTEHGHTYPLSLVLQEGPAQSILLMPIGEGVAAKWEQSSGYESLLRTLVQAMVNQTPLEGFVSETLKPKRVLSKIKHAKITPLQAYRGHKLQGQVLEVSNIGKQELFLVEDNFYQRDVRAITILNPLVPVKGKTLIFIVRSS